MSEHDPDDIEFHFCEECGESFPWDELKAEDIFGPYLCERCRGEAEADREHYRETNIWLNKNR